MNSNTETTEKTMGIWPATEANSLLRRIQREYQRVTYPMIAMKKFGATNFIMGDDRIILELTFVSLVYNVTDGTLSFNMGNYNRATNFGMPLAKEHYKLPVNPVDPELSFRSMLATVVSTEYIGAQGGYIDPIVDALYDDDNDFVDLPFGEGVPEHFYDINFLVDYFNHRQFV